MSKGVLLYALNNEQVDYVKIAYHAAKQAKKYLKLPIALVTDSSDWLQQQHPDYKSVFDMIIKVVHQSSIEDWQVNKQYNIGNLVFHNGTIWKKIKDGKEILDLEKNLINLDNFSRIYEGIDIDKWYPNLPYLKGQHVWYENIVYKCTNTYSEDENFSVSNYEILINDVYDGEVYLDYLKGDKILFDRNLWIADHNYDYVDIKEFNLNDFQAVYEGIDIDKWYPNLPYLKGQHVWYEDCLYRCEIGYTEKQNFSKEKYTVLLESIKELAITDRFSTGDILLHDRRLWLSLIDHNLKEINYNVSDDLEPVYAGIDIDKWYPNLPYLKGQHVWFENKLYRCNIDYNEKDVFSELNYECLLDRVLDLSWIIKFSKGDILLYNRTLWLSHVNYDKNLNQRKIRDDIWEDTKERHLVWDSAVQYRKYFDGSLIYKRLKFKNDIRIKSFEISPFDETLVIDCDYFINNDKLKYCWEQPHDFLIFKDALDLSGYRNDPRLKTVSDKSIDFYWATVFFFKKNKNTEIFFNYLGHIQDNWNYYRHIYQIDHSLYRNDYAFSIAIHVMNGYQKGDWAYSLPGKLHYCTDRDFLLEYNDSMKFLIEKENYRGEYTLMKVENLNVHVMNKFSISRVLDYIQNLENSL